MSEAKHPVGQGAGRGLLFITVAKVYFILTAFGVQVALPRLLGAPEVFGDFTLAMSLVSVVNNVLIASTVQSVSKRVSESLEHAAARLRQALGIQLAIGAVVGSTLLALAPLLGRFAGDPDIVPLLKITAIVPFCYAVYGAMVGSLNGRRLFQRQAALDMSYSTLRSLGVAGLAALGYGAMGAVSGFAAAGVTVLALAIALVGVGKRGEALPVRMWLGFMLPIVLFQTSINGMLLLDVWVLKRSLTALGLEAGQLAHDATKLASHYVGLYRAGQTFALVPYQLVLSVTFIVFPLVARSVSKGDRATTQRTIEDALRFSLLVLLAVASPVSGAAHGVLRIAYQEQFLPGADALTVLVFGQSALALFVICSTVLTASGRPAIPLRIGFVSLLVMLGANHLLVRWVGIGEHTLAAASIATSLGPVSALALIAWALRDTFGVFIRPLTLVRSAICAAVGWNVAHALPTHTAGWALLAMTAGGLSYLAALAVSGEVGTQDVQRMWAALRRR